MSCKERVTDVVDGDTFKTSHRKRLVRLKDVDAPELGTRGGQAAKRQRESLIGGKTVSIEPVARDRYGRTVVRVKVGRRSVNRLMADQ